MISTKIEWVLAYLTGTQTTIDKSSIEPLEPRTSEHKMSCTTNYFLWRRSSDFDLDHGPTSCHCGTDPAHAVDHRGGRLVWECSCGNWVVPESGDSHSAHQCSGNCSEHPLLYGQTLELHLAVQNGTLWGDILLAWEDAEIAKETPEQKAARAAARLAQDHKMVEGVIDYSVAKKTERWTDKSGEMKFRVPRCCRYETLFLEGKEARGCWMHEKGEPCIYVHPDQPQWADAMANRLCYDRDAQAFYLKGQPVPQPSEARRKEMQQEAERQRQPQKGRQGHQGQGNRQGQQSRPSSGQGQQSRPSSGQGQQSRPTSGQGQQSRPSSGQGQQSSVQGRSNAAAGGSWRF